MKFRQLTRQFTRVNEYASALKSRGRLYKFQSVSFSNLRNQDDKEPIVSPKKSALKQVSEFQKSVQQNIEKTLSQSKNYSSFWSLIAYDNEHRDWIERYNKQLSKYKTAEYQGEDFKNTISSLRYIGCNAFDGIQRFRMRQLKRSLICYEEFMIGALNAFKSIPNLDHKDKINISRCFASNLQNDVKEIKNALFNCNDKKNQYVISNIIPFAGKLEFMESLPRDLEMMFGVRYYYSLQNDNLKDNIIHKYADFEWKGIFQPKLTKEGKFETFKLSDKGFLIQNVEVDDF